MHTYMTYVCVYVRWGESICTGVAYVYVYKQRHMFVGVGWHMFVSLLKGEYVCMWSGVICVCGGGGGMFVCRGDTCLCVCVEHMFVYVDGGFVCSLREAHVCMWMGALCSLRVVVVYFCVSVDGHMYVKGVCSQIFVGGHVCVHIWRGAYVCVYL